MTVVVLGLASAIAWGVADFLGGLKNRAVALIAVGLVSQFAALVICVVAIVAMAAEPPGEARLWYAVAAGGANVVGVLALYRSLAVGRMSIVAPILGLAATIPVITGLVQGEQPAVSQAVGIAVAITGVVLASRHIDTAGAHPVSRAAVPLALIAAAGLGANLMTVEAAVREGSAADVFWAAAVTRAVTLAVLLGVFGALRRIEAPGRRHVPALIALGVVDLSANVLYAFAARESLLSVAAVLASLHPVVTVLLARAVLGERLRAVQQGGVVLAVAGVALIAAG
jgi:drug/metabolite transporter (DMT)-like permease